MNKIFAISAFSAFLLFSNSAYAATAAEISAVVNAAAASGDFVSVKNFIDANPSAADDVIKALFDVTQSDPAALAASAASTGGPVDSGSASGIVESAAASGDFSSVKNFVSTNPAAVGDVVKALLVVTQKVLAVTAAKSASNNKNGADKAPAGDVLLAQQPVAPPPAPPALPPAQHKASGE
ncbi:MAG: hypothetical protein PHX43_07105 [Alphaproteobacteria bacterium]|nr:hypothetical protein [Alphaproteobacteria bacterium]